MCLFRLTCITILSIAGYSYASLADANNRLLAHMGPIFQKEEEALIVERRRPVLNGATLGSLEEASARVAQLIQTGNVSKDKGERLLHSLEAAQKVRKLVSLLDRGTPRND